MELNWVSSSLTSFIFEDSILLHLCAPSVDNDTGTTIILYYLSKQLSLLQCPIVLQDMLVVSFSEFSFE
jgi:hypothetical protein